VPAAVPTLEPSDRARPPAGAADASAFRIETPVGPLRVEHDGHAVRAIRYLDSTVPREPGIGGPGTPFGRRVAAELAEYFEGGRRAFTVPIAAGGTPFQAAVWDALRQIPCGRTTTYAALAERVGSPRAIRAVGQANRRNPVPIMIPCHRVVAADGGLGGYLGADGASTALDVKRWLLRHEGALALLDL
jgi:methylated-DNA-[protein]-cysteine S-methyltransferase